MLGQFIAAFAATVGLIPDGMQYGWTSPIIPILQLRNSAIKIEASDVVWLENSFSLGALIGILFTIYNVNRHGRKMSILTSAILKLIGWFLIGNASNVGALLLGRILNGFASNLAFVSATVYIAEISHVKNRRSLLSMVYMMMLLGISLMYCIGPYIPIFASSLVGVFILAIQIILIPLMPKSPYFLLLKGDVDRARLSLGWFQGLEDVEDLEDELQNLIDVVDCQQSENRKFIDLFKSSSNRRAMMGVVFLNCIQQFSGFSAIIMNLETILLQSSSLIDPKISTIVFAFFMVISTVNVSALVDRLGRKVLLIYSSLLTSISLLSLAVYFTISNKDEYFSYNFIPVAAVMLYAVAFKFGLSMLPIITTGELFPTGMKGMGMAVADSSYAIFAFISIYLYQFLIQNCNMQTPFYVFAFCSFGLIFLIKYCIPETRCTWLDIETERLLNFI